MMRFRYPDKPIDTTPDHIRSLDHSDWIAQCKYDGWRMQIYVHENGVIEPLTRMGKDIRKHARVKVPTNIIDEITTLDLPPGTVLDAEFVGPRGNHQPRIYVFDALAWAGEWLTTVPYENRWQRCCGLSDNLKQTGLIRLVTTVQKKNGVVLISPKGQLPGNSTDEQWMANPFIALFDILKTDWQKTQDLSLCEGIVVKRLQGTLHLDCNSSKKSGAMLKLKFRDIEDERY